MRYNTKKHTAIFCRDSVLILITIRCATLTKIAVLYFHTALTDFIEFKTKLEFKTISKTVLTNKSMLCVKLHNMVGHTLKGVVNTAVTDCGLLELPVII